MTHGQLLTLLLPPVSYDMAGKYLQAQLNAEGKALDTAQAAADLVSDGITPYRAGDLLADWERVLGLDATSDNYQGRLEAVLIKLAETGGLSIPYFIKLASSIGYTIQINEFLPFMVDYSRVDRDALYEEDVVWCWEVVILGGENQSTYPFYVDRSRVDERLLSIGDAVIETVFQDLKPAHTFVFFTYRG